jgi:putative SOS response-associated peptidase YedK
MPVLLPTGRFSDWLAPGPLSPDTAEAILVPHPAEGMEAVPVSTRVNSPKHDDPECVKPIGDQRSLGF